jgi:membrane-bound lytic murein transglycosylase D
MSSARLILLSALTVTACMPRSAVPVTSPIAARPDSAPVAPSRTPTPTIEFDTAADTAADRAAAESTAEELEVSPGAATERAAPPPDASWDIEVREYLDHHRVEFYLERFTGSARDRVVSWMQRGIRYEPMIRKTFREAGIAEDFYYLALVESGYDPHAYSRAHAVGMWQFIASTGRAVGLRIDWWVDERRDPMAATRAAARFLGDLHDRFGSQYLAAAAYNGGPGRVSRGLTRFARAVGDSEGDDQFFALAGTRALRAETSNYVPQIIAAAAIGKEPWKYGIKFDSVAPYAYDSVRVGPGTAVAAVALAAGAPLDSIRDLNPHLLRGATAPKDSAWVRVPAGHAVSFGSAFAALPDSTRNAWKAVKVTKATTLGTMARTAGVTEIQVRWYNPTIRSSRVAAGTVVNVPTKLAVAGAFNVPTPGLTRGMPAANGVHIVQRGETLSHIANWNGTTVSRLLSLNGLKKNTIFPGQRIRVRPAPKAGG